MSDLLSPILVVMENEVDAFWCFAGFMERVVSSFNPLPDDKILDCSKLKQNADDILKYILNEKYCYKEFLLYSQCFPQLYIFSASKCGIVC